MNWVRLLHGAWVTWDFLLESAEEFVERCDPGELAEGDALRLEELKEKST